MKEVRVVPLLSLSIPVGKEMLCFKDDDFCRIAVFTIPVR